MTMTLSGTTGGIGVIGSGTAVASTSGTSIDFTSLPAGLKRVTVMLTGVSTNGSSHPLIQIGAGSVTTSGYAGTGSAIFGGSSAGVGGYTAGFGIRSGTATSTLSGAIVLTLLTSNTWTCSGIVSDTTNSSGFYTSGAIALGGTLDRVRVTTSNGIDTFDAGSINILYE